MTSGQLLVILSSTDTGRGARRAAAERLAQAPPTEALLGLFDVYQRFRDPNEFAGCCPSPMAWGPHEAAEYAWFRNLKNAAYGPEEKAAALLGILAERQVEICKPTPPTVPGEIQPVRLASGFRGLALLLDALRENWVGGTETAVASMVTNGDLDSGCRLTAATRLVYKTGTKYLDAILAAAVTASLEDQEWYARLLLGAEIAPGSKGRVLRYAVNVVEADKTRGYFVARAMERHAGRGFLPPLVSGRLPQNFERQTVDNALEWWESHKDQLLK